MNSLRRRLLLGTAAATILVFVAAAVVLYWASRSFLVSEFDGNLAAKARLIASMVEFRGERVGVDGNDLDRFPEFFGGENPEYFHIRTDDGRTARSPTLKKAGDPTLPQNAFLTLPSGHRGRTVSVHFDQPLDDDAKVSAPAPRPGSTAGAPLPSTEPTTVGLTITLARSTSELDRLLARLPWLLALVCGIGALLLQVIASLVIGRSLVPVNQLAREISSIGAQGLDERLSAGVPRELNPIVLRLNEMLGRLQSAFEREKCFTSDAAHELRTPLAGLQVALEVCASQRREPAHYEHVVSDCLVVVGRMNAMIDNLLLLARTEDNRVAVKRTEVNATALLHEAFVRCKHVAEARSLHVRWEVDSPLWVCSDATMLATIFLNLLDNAAQHANETGEVRIVAKADRAEAQICISNTGSKVRPADAPRVFDRFWRADTARSHGGRMVPHHLDVAVRGWVGASRRTVIQRQRAASTKLLNRQATRR